jgi:hypothetical protein
MSGRLNEPGTLEIEWLDGTASIATYDVVSGPWTYAEWLCWIPADDRTATKYAPLANIATWSKSTTNERQPE